MFCVGRKEFGLVEELMGKFGGIGEHGLENLVGILWDVAAFKYQGKKF